MQNEDISSLIVEFYNTTDENVRKQHTLVLNSLHERMFICHFLNFSFFC